MLGGYLFDMGNSIVDGYFLILTGAGRYFISAYICGRQCNTRF